MFLPPSAEAFLPISPEIKALAAEHNVKFVKDMNGDGQLTKSDVFATKKFLADKALTKVEPKPALAKV